MLERRAGLHPHTILFSLFRVCDVNSRTSTVAIATEARCYADDDTVIPDVVWISTERLAQGLDAAGHLHERGPELVVEVVRPGAENARRDRETKLALYSRRDAVEYWIVDPVARTVQQYGRGQGGGPQEPLQPRGFVGYDDWLRSDLLRASPCERANSGRHGR
jgi:Uma2 family endonuclease